MNWYSCGAFFITLLATAGSLFSLIQEDWFVYDAGKLFPELYGNLSYHYNVGPFVSTKNPCNDGKEYVNKRTRNGYTRESTDKWYDEKMINPPEENPYGDDKDFTNAAKSEKNGFRWAAGCETIACLLLLINAILMINHSLRKRGRGKFSLILLIYVLAVATLWASWCILMSLRIDSDHTFHGKEHVDMKMKDCRSHGIGFTMAISASLLQLVAAFIFVAGRGGGDLDTPRYGFFAEEQEDLLDEDDGSRSYKRVV